MKSVAIVGVGLIGGSFGLALRAAGFKGSIVGVSSSHSIETAVGRGAIDRGVPLEQAAAESDLIFLAQPIHTIVETLRKLDSMVNPGALVTDAGSTKQVIVNAAAEWLHRCAFLGGHPMAGKEKRGAYAADATLFRGRTWILTGSPEHPTAAAFRQWLARIGAKELMLDAATHDRLVAWSSHLPQMASTALAAALQDGAPDAAMVAGPGLLDATRLALSSFDLWRDIVDTNAVEIGRALDAYIEQLSNLRASLPEQFEKGRAFAESLRARRSEP